MAVFECVPSLGRSFTTHEVLRTRVQKVKYRELSSVSTEEALMSVRLAFVAGLRIYLYS